MTFHDEAVCPLVSPRLFLESIISTSQLLPLIREYAGTPVYAAFSAHGLEMTLMLPGTKGLQARGHCNSEGVP